MPPSDSQGSADDDPWFRIPACSSAFFALATLTPPSPDPSVSSIHSLNFDDFPIFLVDSVADSSVESSPDLVSKSPLPVAGSITGIAEAESFVSIGSFGTFGQRRGGMSFNSPFSIAESPIDEDYAMDSLCEYYMSTSPPPSPTNAEYLEARLVQKMMVSPGHDGPGILEPREEADEIAATYHMAVSSSVLDLIGPSSSIILDDDSPAVLSPQPLSLAKPLESGMRVSPKEGRPTPQEGERGPSRIGTPASASVSRAHRSAPHRPRKEKDREVEFVWLHGISVDLLIDQEGFRSATPSFKYSGVNRSKHDKATCTVTFRATSKQGYYFHYNPFDSSPILRRVTIHGEETKDYISKQAQLTLKANGVYSVHGAEMSSLSPLHSRIFNQLGHDLDKLDWEFEYLVQDRVDTQGRIIDGEKKFVPLTFTCSPWLLHPSQGKRVNLMHIFKKGVLNGKLTAEKAKSRLRPSPAPRRMDEIPGISMMNIGGTTTLMGQDEVCARTHRRAKSHAVPRDEKHDGTQVAMGARARAVSGGHKEVDPGQHINATKCGTAKPATPQTLFRRSSSAGDESWLSLSF